MNTSTAELEVLELMMFAAMESAATNRQVAGKMILQGGNALKYVYGSPRASVDLDWFSNASRDEVKQTIKKTLATLKGWAPRYGLQADKFRLKAHNKNDTRNPMIFEMIYARPVGQSDWRVRIESMQVGDADLFGKYEFQASKPARGVALHIVTPLIATAKPGDILVDKVHALARRSHLKARDIFDMAWIAHAFPDALDRLNDATLAEHLAMYNDQASVTQIYELALERLSQAQQKIEDMLEQINIVMPYPVTREAMADWIAVATSIIATHDNAARPEAGELGL